jgi:hypothetical protein
MIDWNELGRTAFALAVFLFAVIGFVDTMVGIADAIRDRQERKKAQEKK